MGNGEDSVTVDLFHVVEQVIKNTHCIVAHANLVQVRKADGRIQIHLRKVFLSFSETENLPARARTVLTGNPVRQSILAIRHGNEHSSSGQRRVLVLGGSQGAKGINEAVIQALPALRAAGFTLRHQTGEQDFEKVRQAYAERSLHGCVEPFIADMARAYSECDMVLCRAGATTLAELGVAGKPSLLVPFPYATGDHQTKNARAMERLGASMVISQNQLADLSLARILDDVFNLPGKLREMAVAAKAWGRPGAAADIVAELRRLAGIPV
ncbi:MAG: UDP-N-acetylglucosamine--N-acetylmuramyl-(pentapeptide) pyrophosphoryl-undecaprenol N-acetylglucosamine transferase [Deltaproteobacteria bacterium]|nr:UDP-N-acetylglucosamine--N-acetylmuramyl-(pentapeptide) pyrophosphoryl-undecaprenol N-acetylglucosamine transferase [Deltaproteobacteria bacterium]